MDYRAEAPEIVRDFLVYHETIKGHSKKTADEYFLDLRMLFRFLKLNKGLVPDGTDFDDITIKDINLAFIKTITLTDIYAYLSYLARERPRSIHSRKTKYGITASSRARKIATIRSYFNYLTNKTKQLAVNPVADLDTPKSLKTLPRYLSLDESVQLLSSVEGKHKERDYCILTLFLNCGLRISELAGLDVQDISAESIRVLGKGNKERIVYINDACVDALNDYIRVRAAIKALDTRALFLSARRTRITSSTVHNLVKNHITAAGLDAKKYSSHKLRHTAATLMLRAGVDVRTLQELLGHEHLNTTQIYTHVESDSLREAARLSPLSGLKQSGGRSKKKQSIEG